MEFEVKYTYPNSNAQDLKRLLSAKFIADPKYPSGIITSIYFDTTTMDFYEEKRASTYLKTKIRLRWYNDTESKLPIGTSFWEVKSRVGTRRSKERRESSLSPLQLDSIEMHDPALLREAHQQQLRSGGGLVILPAVAVRYTRHRYVDTVNGSRLNVDSNIHAHRINPSLANERSKLSLPVGVLEYKGEYDQISPYLSQVGGIGAKKDAFSKYESVIKWVKSNHRLY